MAELGVLSGVCFDEEYVAGFSVLVEYQVAYEDGAGEVEGWAGPHDFAVDGHAGHLFAAVAAV